jgi:hypothetical protein
VPARAATAASLTLRAVGWPIAMLWLVAFVVRAMPWFLYRRARF